MRETIAKPILKNYAIHLKDRVEVFTKQLVYYLFDTDYRLRNEEVIKGGFLKILKVLHVDGGIDVWKSYKNEFSEIRRKLDLDALAFEKTDPACKSLEEVYLAYPGFYAIAVYRLSHELLNLGVPILPRMMSEYAHSATGTDIHPGATIGSSFFIDHATGIVIGETTVINEHVKIYQGVTLGGIQVKKSLARTKRHPTVEKNVTIYANATILGGDVTIGENSIIGANVCITESIPENSLITNQSENKMIKRSV